MRKKNRFFYFENKALLKLKVNTRNDRKIKLPGGVFW